MERGGKAILNRPIINYADRDLEAVRTMVEHPQTLMGLGDGGAHVGIICDASSRPRTCCPTGRATVPAGRSCRWNSR